MSIAPIVTTVTVRAPPDRAFDLFTSHIGSWWPAGKTVAKSAHVAIVIEPYAGGRWFERDADGRETQWGKVLDWRPPGRLLLGWQLNGQWAYDPDLVTEVELRFAPADGGGTLVTLEHRHLERFGIDAERLAGEIGTGWPSRLADFVSYSDARA